MGKGVDMKVRMLKETPWNPPGRLLAGEVYELRNVAAADLVKRGAAEYLEQAAVTNGGAETAVSGKRRRGRPRKVRHDKDS